ncbi:hypothetical protein AJ80_04542 [Polytolypa hystricis UAMH7299]|uniref:Copper transport protein n=1 Tax=Polytolypa hystricis (strain UAMH7299) TaxID=1447883 RepID=A0A2B7YA72_POLH7|nr:hypothetical protein AJ80_04542 [Polytolypa hystricis UAMH7299]
MDHSMHSTDHGHGDMDGDTCDMNMLFTWSSKNLCIIFRQWRVTGTFSLLLSLVAIVLLTAGYEAVREITRRYEASRRPVVKDTVPGQYTDQDAEIPPDNTTHPDNTLPTSSFTDRVVHQESTSSLLLTARRAGGERRSKVVLATLYAIQVFYSFFIM